tara:strand:- start:214 stop:501 length:288 start_codon:yes stop_codon:yes gene_type:complete
MTSNNNIPNKTPPYFKKSTPRCINNAANDNIATNTDIVLSRANIMVSDETVDLDMFIKKPKKPENSVKNTNFNEKLSTLLITYNKVYRIATGMNK